MLTKKVTFQQTLVGVFQFLTNCKSCCDFPVSERPTNEIKTRFFVEINLFIILVRVDLYPAALQKI